MSRIIAIIVLATFLPVQAFAGAGLDFDPVEQELLLVKPLAAKQEQLDRSVANKLMETPPKTVAEGKTGTNWWLWGGVGLAAVVGGVVALSGGKSGGGGSSSLSSNSTTVTGSW